MDDRLPTANQFGLSVALRLLRARTALCAGERRRGGSRPRAAAKCPDLYRALDRGLLSLDVRVSLGAASAMGQPSALDPGGHAAQYARGRGAGRVVDVGSEPRERIRYAPAPNGVLSPKKSGDSRGAPADPAGLFRVVVSVPAESARTAPVSDSSGYSVAAPRPFLVHRGRVSAARRRTRQKSFFGANVRTEN